MTHEEKLQLAEISGILTFALWWAESQRDLGLESMTNQDDDFARGFGVGEVRVAEDAILSLKKAIARLDPLWKGV